MNSLQMLHIDHLSFIKCLQIEFHHSLRAQQEFHKQSLSKMGNCTRKIILTSDKQDSVSGKNLHLLIVIPLSVFYMVMWMSFVASILPY